MSRRGRWVLLALVVAGAGLGLGARRWWQARATVGTPVAAGIAPRSAVRPPRARDSAPPHLLTATVPRLEDLAAPTPGAEPAPAYHPRDPAEWQGMLVDLSIHPECERSSDCGLARACRQGHCGPCAQDAECAAGERCALDHCLPGANVRCRSRRECQSGDVCILTGLSSDPRNNAGLFAACGRDVRPPEQHWTPPPSDPEARVQNPAVDGERLLELLRAEPAPASTR